MKYLIAFSFICAALCRDAATAQHPFADVTLAQPTVTTITYTTNVYDNFNRANGSIGTAVIGGAWLDSGDWIVSGNIAKQSSGNVFCFIDSGVSDCIIQVDVVTIGSNGPGITFRYVDGNNWFYFIQYGTDCYLQKFAAGVLTTPIGPIAGSANGDTLKVVLSGSLIKCYRNGVQVGGDVTDSFQATATKHGMVSPATDATFDNFVVYR